MTFWEIFLHHLHSTANLLPLVVLEKLKIFFEKPIVFQKEGKFRTFWDILLIQLHSTVNLLHLAIFQENHNFFSENTPILCNKTNFWTFWEILLFQWPCSATMLILVVLKKSRYITTIPSIFFHQKTYFLKV